MENLFGYTAEEMIGRPVSVLFTPEDRALMMPEFELRTAKENARAEDDRWHVRNNGTRVWISGVTTSLRDEHGKLIQATGLELPPHVHQLDDAVARLYRAAEALAQMALHQNHGFESTGQVPLERLPETLRSEWGPRAEAGTVPLGLQDDYRLLRELEDPLGVRFFELGWDDREKSPLIARSQSILAHGFQAITQASFEQLWRGILQLAEIEEQQLPAFPKLRAHG